jgi:phage tail sheath gpL-like
MSLAFFPEAIPLGWLVPGIYSAFEFGVDQSGEYSGVLKCLCVGSTSSASALPEGVPTRIRTPDEADALIGSRELLAHGVRTALERRGVPVYALRTPTAASPVKAYIEITGTGTATTTGRIGFEMNNTKWYVTLASGTTAAQAATKIRDAILLRARLPITSTALSAVATITVVTPGTSGNLWVIGLIVDELPSGLTFAVSNATVLDDDRYQFTDGVGAEVLTSTFDLLASGTTSLNYYERLAFAVTDTDNAEEIRDYVWDMAESTIGKPQCASLGHNGSFSAASALPVSVNDAAMRVAWKQNAMEHPFQLACALAAMQAYFETLYANTLYDGEGIPGISPFYVQADRPSDDTLSAAIEAGLSPITSDDLITARVVQLITTWATKDGLPFAGCRDVGKWATPVYIERDLREGWKKYREQNKSIRDNWGRGEDPVQGVGTPRTWQQSINAKLRKHERSGLIVIGNLQTEVQWIREQKCFGSYVHVYPTDLHHQTGLVMRQVYRT